MLMNQKRILRYPVFSSFFFLFLLSNCNYFVEIKLFAKFKNCGSSFIAILTNENLREDLNLRAILFNLREQLNLDMLTKIYSYELEPTEVISVNFEYLTKK